MSAGKRLPCTPEPLHWWDGHGGVKIAGGSWGNPDAGDRNDIFGSAVIDFLTRSVPLG